MLTLLRAAVPASSAGDAAAFASDPLSDRNTGFLEVLARQERLSPHFRAEFTSFIHGASKHV